jgi:aminoglycoside phosphotransferase (APT) family kinase protein
LITVPAAADPQPSVLDRIDEELVDRLRLTPERVLSADGDSFVTLLCRDTTGAQRVLKYVSGGAHDAHRRLTNETRLVTQLHARPPLQLLKRRDDGHGYLVTDYDPGRLLRTERLDDDATLRAIAGALVEFQTIRANADTMGIVDREGIATYYLKVLLKHIVHLWPAHLGARDAIRSVRAVMAALPAIRRRRVACHGDLLPTNLLYHAAEGRVTFTDLEGFMTANHPLFDVLALFTIDQHDLRCWKWQQRFLRFYLARSEAIGLDPRSSGFARAYRGILIFFLVYRLNEARIRLTNNAYFDGVGRLRYVSRKAAHVMLGRADAWQREPAAALDVRADNLRYALSPSGFRQHLDEMLAFACA